jgi:hypothetical protein
MELFIKIHIFSISYFTFHIVGEIWNQKFKNILIKKIIFLFDIFLRNNISYMEIIISSLV